VSGHELRARTLVAKDDPRIRRALWGIPPKERPVSPDAAYWQAALVVAHRDAREEIARKQSPGCYRAGYALGILLVLSTIAGAVWTIVWLWSLTPWG
jgi:type IV secretory pathway VirB3-like protein